jgi:hypothetical protein
VRKVGGAGSASADAETFAHAASGLVGDSVGHTYSVIMPATDRPPTMDRCVDAILATR